MHLILTADLQGEKMKYLLTIFFLIFTIILFPTMLHAGEAQQPIVITKSIYLRIPDRGMVDVTQEIMDEKETKTENKATVAKEKKEDKNVKITLNFTEGKFSQIKEEVFVGGKIEKEQDIKTLSDESKIVRKYTVLKDTSQPKKVIYTFLSL